MTPEIKEKSGNKLNIALVVLFCLSLLLNGYLLYSYYQDNYNGGKSLKTLNAELEAVLSKTAFSKDSLAEQYALLEQRYQNIMNEFEGIKAERDQALADAGAKAIKIRNLLGQVGGDPKAAVQLRSEIESLKKELVEKKVQLDEVKLAKEKYQQEAQASQGKADALKKQKDASDQKAQQLENKLKNAKFQIDELYVKPLRSKGGKMEVTDKAGKIDQIEVTFTVSASDLVVTGNKEIALRILGINGEVLGANNTTLVDSDKLVSLRQTVDYQGTEKNIKFNFKQEELYKKGGHTAEIWYEGERLVRTQFNLN